MARPKFDPTEVERFENATWSRVADTYMDGFGALVGEAVGPLLDEVKIGEAHRVLDVGTGPGLVAAAVAERGADVVGIDFSDAMVAKARQLHPHLEFLGGRAESLPFDDGSFDAVVGNFMLHHAARPDEVLREAFRVLRDGGRVGFTVWADLSKLEAFRLFFAAVEQYVGAPELPYGPLFGVSDFEVFHRMLRNTGFGRSSVRELPIAWHTTSLDSYLASFRDWADLESFPRSARAGIEATVRKSAEAYRIGSAYIMPNPAVLATGVK